MLVSAVDEVVETVTLIVMVDAAEIEVIVAGSSMTFFS